MNQYIIRTLEMVSNNWLTNCITRIQSLEHRYETHLRRETSWKIKPGPIQACDISFACYSSFCPTTKILIQLQHEDQVKLLLSGMIKMKVKPRSKWLMKSCLLCVWAQKNQQDSSDTNEAPPSRTSGSVYLCILPFMDFRTHTVDYTND